MGTIGESGVIAFGSDPRFIGSTLIVNQTAAMWNPVKVKTVVPLPAHTKVGSGFGARLIALVNGALPQIDGITVNPGDRLLLDQDGDPAPPGDERGIWIADDVGSASSPWIFTRSTDCDDSDTELLSGKIVFVQEGATAGKAGYVLTTQPPVFLDDPATPLVFEIFTSTGGVIPAPGINGQILFNNGGVIGVNSDLTFDTGTLTFTTVNVEADQLTSPNPELFTAVPITPAVNNTQSIGTNALRFADVFATDLNAPNTNTDILSPFAGTEVLLTAPITPSVNNTQSAGTALLAFADTFATTTNTNNLTDLAGGVITLNADIVPSADNTFDLGAVGLTFNTAYIREGVIGVLSTIEIQSSLGTTINLLNDLVPDGVVDIGAVGNRFDSIFANTVNATNGRFDTLDIVAGTEILLSAPIAPAVNNTESVGTAALAFANIFGTATNTNSLTALVGTIILNSTMTPAADLGTNLGTALLRYDQVFCRDLASSFLTAPTSLTIASTAGNLLLFSQGGNVVITGDTGRLVSIQSDGAASGANNLTSFGTTTADNDVPITIRAGVIDGDGFENIFAFRTAADTTVFNMALSGADDFLLYESATSIVRFSTLALNAGNRFNGINTSVPTANLDVADSAGTAGAGTIVAGSITLATTGGTPSALDFYESGTTVSTTFTCGTASGSAIVNVKYKRIGTQVFMELPTISFLSGNAGTGQINASAAMPARFRPPADIIAGYLRTTNAGTVDVGFVFITDTGAGHFIQLHRNTVGTAWSTLSTVGTTALSGAYTWSTV